MDDLNSSDPLIQRKLSIFAAISVGLASLSDRFPPTGYH